MRNGKYLDDYNYHDWTLFMVRELKEKPKGPHFAAILFDQLDYTSPGYDRDDSSYSTSFKHVSYFAFPDQETLREWVLRAAKAKMQFFFFEVKNIGNAELRIDIDLKV